ncbi:MAG: 50S ribosomal protein L11 methyltransferase [Bacteroidia bacterium]|nr:50S ribosomal protein L11 methyltransferase [Bacteroidia bacterium]
MTDRKFLKLTFPISEAEHEVWVAMLNYLGCYAFEAEDEALYAFIEPDEYDAALFQETLAPLVQPGQKLKWTTELIEDRDWNAEWEKSFMGIRIGDFCQILPSFREPEPGILHTVYIDPKMAFGTGHHQTTRLMVRQAELLDFEGEKVLDMGCGSGILAILADKLGAESVLAVDYDPLATDNTAENIGVNGVERVTVQLGDSAAKLKGKFGIIFANINRNVLLTEAGPLSERLAKGGTLLLSGFYETDVEVLSEKYAEYGLGAVRKIIEDEWVSLALMRKGEY